MDLYLLKEAEQMILDYEKHDVPLDNIVIDTDWRRARDRGIGYEINTELFPDMKAWFEFAHDHHVEVMFNDHPEPAEGADNLLSPVEMAYRDENLTALLEMGLDTWWYDRNWSTKLETPVASVAAETRGNVCFFRDYRTPLSERFRDGRIPQTCDHGKCEQYHQRHLPQNKRQRFPPVFHSMDRRY